MTRTSIFVLVTTFGLMLLNGCGTLYTVPYTQEETGLSITKITDDNTPVIAGVYSYTFGGNVIPSKLRLLSVSPKGDYLTFISRINNQYVACIRKTESSNNQITQRTFRPTISLSWGNDGKIYFGDDSHYAYRQICSVNGLSGSLMKQHTNGCVDQNPILSKDGKKLFFERVINGNSSIWCYELSNSSLTHCCDGACPYPIDKSGTKILCSRKTGATYAIWIIDYEKGEEIMLVSNDKQNFVTPSLSPDGKWILFTANTYSSISKKDQLDIYCIKTDGSNLTRLTSHPAHDQSPVWSSDGKQIYFISERMSSKKQYGIWRMNFVL